MGKKPRLEGKRFGDSKPKQKAKILESHFIFEKMFGCPLVKYSPISLGLIQPAFPAALEPVAVFISHEVLGLHLGLCGTNIYL